MSDALTENRPYFLVSRPNDHVLVFLADSATGRDLLRAYIDAWIRSHQLKGSVVRLFEVLTPISCNFHHYKFKTYCTLCQRTPVHIYKRSGQEFLSLQYEVRTTNIKEEITLQITLIWRKKYHT